VVLETTPVSAHQSADKLRNRTTVNLCEKYDVTTDLLEKESDFDFKVEVAEVKDEVDDIDQKAQNLVEEKGLYDHRLELHTLSFLQWIY
jgi:hypothetical protein